MALALWLSVEEHFTRLIVTRTAPPAISLCACSVLPFCLLSSSCVCEIWLHFGASLLSVHSERGRSGLWTISPSVFVLFCISEAPFNFLVTLVFFLLLLLQHVPEVFGHVACTLHRSNVFQPGFASISYWISVQSILFRFLA